MKKIVILNLLIIFILSSNFSFGQNDNKVKGQKQDIYAIGVEGYDEPEYLVMYEVIPFMSNTNCNQSKNTILFEIPTTYEYYSSIKINQEVTSWFKVFGSENEYISGNLIGKDKDRWKLIIRSKRIITKGDIE